MSSSAGDGPSSSACKGKALMDDDAEHEPVATAAEGVPCGICFTDSRRAIRGELDSCAHHFCFVCIMAWARVESRCPFCKARFRTIRRPPVPGRLPSERIVNVAERNQVYHPRGNESSVVGADPNVNSSCSACNCSNDEDLLLLCELCDVASHTYCVGLGTTVPEGDWFCKDCATSKEEHSRCQVDDGGSSDQGELEITIEAPTAEPVTDPSISDIVDEGDGGSSDQGELEITIEAPTAEPVTDPSISDIVDEGYSLSSLRRANARSSGPIPVPSIYDNVDDDYGTNAQRSESLPVPSVYDIVDENYEVNAVRRRNLRSTRPERRANDLPSQSTSSDGSHSHESPQERGSGRALLHANARFGIERARTLPNSRNLSNRIMMLRENWPAIRAGSAGFATHLRNSSASSSVKEHQQSVTPSSKDTSYVNKAWKMLEIAKSAGGRKKCNKPSSQDCTPRFSMGNRSTSFSPIDTILGQMNQSLPPTVTQRNTVKYDRGAKRDNALPGKDIEGQCNLLGSHHVLVCERIGSFQNRMANQASPSGKVASSSHLKHVDQKPESSCGTKVASSSHRQHADQTLESARGARVSGKPKTDVLDPSANGLASGRPTVVSPLQFVSRAGSQSGTTINPEEPSAVCVTTPNEIGTVAAAAVEVSKGSGPDRDGSKRKHRSGTGDEQASKKARKSAKIAKGEISSLAMRELKLLKIDKTYGSDRFKEVARAATHTVLASYGLEHTPSVALALPKPVCKHSSRTEPSKPSVITNTCKECLRDFVKQAISSALSSKQTDQTAASC